MSGTEVLEERYVLVTDRIRENPKENRDPAFQRAGAPVGAFWKIVVARQVIL